MPERPSDPPPAPRTRTDSERAEATLRRETERRAPPISDVKPTFPTEPPLTLARGRQLRTVAPAKWRVVAASNRYGPRARAHIATKMLDIQ
jgi:hypothetical protein